MRLASDYIDSHKDTNSNVPVILNTSSKDRNKRFIELRLSAELAKYLYATQGTGVYGTAATRQVGGKVLFGVIEIYAREFPDQRVTSIFN